jgi:hypothetical protein
LLLVALAAGGGPARGEDPPAPPVDPGEPRHGVVLTVKDGAGAGATAYPVTAVVPLACGAHQDTSSFRIVDGQGRPVPAQFEVLNRWWARDRSLRHVAAHFQASVPADGQVRYRFQTTGAGPAPARPVVVTQRGGVTTVDTGVLRFTVKRRGFNLFDEVFLDTNGDGAYAADERIVAPDPRGGPVFRGRGDVLQRASERTDLEVRVEEQGPMRAVLRVGALTRYEGASDHTHGFALRLYAYAGKSYVKVDYQLQNSAKNVIAAAPLYFEDVSLNVKPVLERPTVRLATGPGRVWQGPVEQGRYLFQSSLTDAAVRSTAGDATLLSSTNRPAFPAFGWADVSDGRRGLFVTIRHMAERWPNGIEVESGHNVAVRLWPRWSAQFFQNQLNATGLYWLEDMQHVCKESLLYFHGPDVASEELDRLAKNFQHHPIPFVDVAEYARTKATLDYGGLLALTEPVGGQDTKVLLFRPREDTKALLFRPHYVRPQRTDPKSPTYNFGWMNFMDDPDRKVAGTAGGLPYTSAAVLATQRVDEWLTAEAAAIGEISCRGQWMAGYEHDTDFKRILLTCDRYGARSWRKCMYSKDSDLPLDSPHIPGTGFGGWMTRYNSHAWFYHVEEFYFLSGNLWLRDWYEFIKEFRQGEKSLSDAPPWSSLYVKGWDMTRGQAHSIANGLQAFRVTGDMDMWEHLRRRLDNLEEHFNRQYGFFQHDAGVKVGAVFEHGFMCRALIQLLEEAGLENRDVHDRVLNLIWGVVEWNHHGASFAYHYRAAEQGKVPSEGMGMAIADAQAWFALKTGRPEYLETVNGYLDGGINGGKPHWDGMADMVDWAGDPLGRVTTYARTYPPRPDPPAAITDLRARPSGRGVELRWTTPPKASRFHVLWSSLPISATFTKDPSQRNPWGCTVVPNTLRGRPGAEQSLEIPELPSGRPVHVAVFSFAAGGDMSPISNVARTAVP